MNIQFAGNFHVFALLRTAGGVLSESLCMLLKGQVIQFIGSAEYSGSNGCTYPRRLTKKPFKLSINARNGPNVAGVIGSAVVAGVLLSIIK